MARAGIIRTKYSDIMSYKGKKNGKKKKDKKRKTKNR